MNGDRTDKIDLLQSWKEISAYLDCDQRTCLRWEKAYGLPVHRLNDAGRSRVFAYRSEVDLWLEKRLKNPKKARSRAAFFKRRGGRLILIAAAFLAAGLVYLIVMSGLRLRPPADFSVSGSRFIFKDGQGREVFAYDSGIESLSNEAEYRDHFQFRRKLKSMLTDLPHIIIKDLDRDGSPEVLLSIQTQSEEREGKLLCFDARGKIEWEFDAGKEMTFGERRYSGDYRIFGFDVYDIDGDGDLEIFAIAHHLIDFPCQVAALDHRGRVFGEYWHSGQFVDIVFQDINGDMTDEVILAGLNNEYLAGVLAVFDPAALSGTSPQADARYKISGGEPGSELYYMRFPRTDLDLLEYRMGVISRVDFLGNGIISLSAGISRIYFELDFSLRPVGVNFSSDFRFLHGKGLERGVVSSSLDDEYVQRLMRGVRYYDGTEWVSHPTAAAAPEEVGKGLNPWGPAR